MVKIEKQIEIYLYLILCGELLINRVFTRGNTFYNPVITRYRTHRTHRTLSHPSNPSHVHRTHRTPKLKAVTAYTPAVSVRRRAGPKWID
jgi:hypothetical protein